KSGDTVEAADVVDVEMQFLYFDGEHWHFMVPESFEQHEMNAKVVDETAKWLKEQDICIVTLWNGSPLSVAPPNFVTLAITETDPGLRGDTSGGGTKAATLETGAVIRVPLFLEIGDSVKVDTRNAEYVSRAK
ncbi:MAG TPA: elongation factor P, partial [Candidatus Berkiella sp.]|nr:elongation factor P [Candidatus Berkiella sp.]